MKASTHMSNPFGSPAATATAPAPAPAVETTPPVSTVKTEAPAEVPGALGMGDPFAGPTGVGTGEYITDMVGRLLLVKPTEIVEEMNTSQGKAKGVVRADIAILDDPEEPGRIAEGVLLFQQALKREAADIFNGPLPYLLGRLNKGKTNGGNTLYTFQSPTEDEVNTARQFISVKTL